MTTITAIKNAILTGLSTTTFARNTGCGRVYVEVISTPSIDQLMTLDKKALRQIKRSAAKILPIIESAVQGTEAKWIGGRIYVGYDNATGKELAKGSAIANELRLIGISACMVAEGD